MQSFLVHIDDKDDMVNLETLCNNKSELVNLLKALDEDKYVIKGIEVINYYEVKNFYKIDPKLEIGDN